MSIIGTREPSKPREHQLLIQKEEVTDPARQEYPFFMTFLARIMAAHEGELLLVALACRM